MARPKLRLDLSTAEDKENQSVVKELKRRSSTDVVGVRELQAFQTQVAKLWTTKEQDDTSSRGSLSSLVDLSNKPSSAVTGTTLDTAIGVGTPDLTVPVSDFQLSSSSSASTSPASALLGQSSAEYQISSAGFKPTGNDPKTQICFDFTKGVCTRGSSCKFSHDVALIVSVNSQERGICFDFLRGQCHRGLLCRFSHDLSSLAAQQCQRGSRRNAPICYDFVKGVCARGPDCRYSHDINSIINDTRHSSQSTHAGQLCHDYSKGRCARGAACRYSHDFSALTAASPLMPALTAAAAAAAIAQISMNPGGLLPQIAPYLQSYMPPTPQHTSLQQHMLHERMHSSAPVLPHPFPFAKTNFPQAGLPRDVAAGQMNTFGVPSPHDPFGAPYTGLTAHSGWQAGSQMPHNSSLLSMRLQAQQASKHMYAPLQNQSRDGNAPFLAAQKSLPELYGIPGGVATAPVGGRSYDSAQTGFANMASRHAGASAAAVQRPVYSPFEALQSLSRESPSVSKPKILTSSLAEKQPSLRSPSTASGTDAMPEPLPPADAVAIPTRPASTPRLTHAYSSSTAPPAAARSLSFTDLQFDRETSLPMQSLADSSLTIQPEQESLDRLCFEAASLGISAPTGKLSVAEVEVECNSSTSDSSSVHALEASDSGLLSAGSGHLFMCQEIWKR
ncbi:hypothetical protein WJX77_011637 [Trebouxia sp. C0004]